MEILLKCYRSPKFIGTSVYKAPPLIQFLVRDNR